MSLGLLILRLVIGCLIAGHGAQKAFGAFGGMGPDGTAPLFEAWGLRPGRKLVLLASAVELAGAALVLLGLATPLGGAMILGAMLVAASTSWSKGLWAVKGGCELPLTYGLMAGVLAFTGPGDWSLDKAFDLTGAPGVTAGVVAWAVAVVLAGVFVVQSRSQLRNRSAAETTSH